MVLNSSSKSPTRCSQSSAEQARARTESLFGGAAGDVSGIESLAERASQTRNEAFIGNACILESRYSPWQRATGRYTSPSGKATGVSSGCMKVTTLLLLPCSLAVSGEEKHWCVIVQTMTRGQQTSSALFTWNTRYQRHSYVEGDCPKGFKFRGSLSDHDLEKIKSSGEKIAIVPPHYTSEDLRNARESCEPGCPEA